MTTIACKDAADQTDQVEVAAGVDTDQDTRTAAVIDRAGRLLGHRQFQARRRGYAELPAWLRSFGLLLVVGIEGTGAYGAAWLATYTTHRYRCSRSTGLTARPAAARASRTRSMPRQAAARAALARVGTGIPKVRTGRVEALRETTEWPGAARSNSVPTACAGSRR